MTFVRSILIILLLALAMAGCAPTEIIPGTASQPLPPTQQVFHQEDFQLEDLQQEITPQETRTPTPMPGALPQVEIIPLAETPLPVFEPTPAPVCETHSAQVVLSAPATRLKVGEIVTVSVALENSGCVALGLPQYRLAVLGSETRPVVLPDKLEPVVHSLAIQPGSADEASFTLQAERPGKAILAAMASFEVHLGYPGPAYWGSATSEQLTLEVVE